MKTRFLPFALVAMIAAPLFAASNAPVLSPDQKTLLRCSAAFGIVAGDQARGAPGSDDYPPLAERGKQFFVLASVRLMDELKLTREKFDALMHSEVETLQRESMESDNPRATVDAVMQPCLASLDLSIPPDQANDD